MRVLKIAGAAIAAVIVVLVLLLVIGIPSDFVSSAIQSRVERETGYRLTIAGSTRIGLWPSLNVTLNDVTLADPKDRDASNRATVGSIQADVTLASLWSGRPEITNLAILHPMLYVPLLRERSVAPTPARPAASSAASDANPPAIDRVTISDGAVTFFNLRDRVENRLDGLDAEALIGADRKVHLTGSVRAGEHPLNFDIKATAPAPPLERQNIPVDFTLEAKGLLQEALSGKAEVRLNGSVIMINGLGGTLGDGAFSGWASVDVASKPLLKLDLDFQRLDVTMPTEPAAPQGVTPWSNAPLDLAGLNYVDARIRISAAELTIGQTHLAPVAIDGGLAGGVLRCVATNLAVYGGQAGGELIVDASAANASYALRSDLVGVRALPLLQSAFDFDKLDGKLQAKIAVRSVGPSPRAIISNLSGTVFANFQDGAIRGLNVAQMIRNLTSSPLSGWQEGKEQTTDLTQFGASFRIDKGQATTNDLTLVGPLVRVTGAGTIDLGAQTLSFRVEPKLVLTTEGQGRTADPVGLGIPVIIDGGWAEPRIYPDMAGMLDHPDAAYAKLKEMGKGLFGANGAGLGSLGGLGGLVGAGSGSGGGSDPLGGKLGETLGSLMQQGLGQNRPQSRNLSAPAAGSTPPASPSPVDTTPQAHPDSQPMNDVLRQLFGR